MNKIQALFLPTVLVGVASIVTSGVACADNIFVSNDGNDTITEIGSGGTTTFGSSANLNDPAEMAFNSAGDLFVANTGSGTIAEFQPSGGTYQFVDNFATGLSNPYGVAFDSHGSLFVSNQGNGMMGNGTIDSFTSATIPVESVVATGLNDPNALAFDSTGNLFVTNYGDNTITFITPPPTHITGTVGVTKVPLDMAHGIAFDSTGNIYVVSGCGFAIEEIKDGSVGSIFTNKSLNQAQNIAVDAGGYVYVTDAGNNTVTEYDSNGFLVGTFSTDLSSPTGIILQASASDPPPLSVPEPSTYALLFAGLGMLFFMSRRKLARA